MSGLASVKGRILDLASHLPAVARWRATRFAVHQSTGKEPELRLLTVLVPHRPFVDVGANMGLYSFFALGCDPSQVLAVEPVPELAQRLGRILGRAGTVQELAISSSDGEQTLTIPTVGGGEQHTRSTLNVEGIEGRSLQVETRRLDHLGVQRDAVIKIDVEGHEMDAISGAEQILGEGLPAALLVESEERHGAGGPSAIISYLAERSYQGWAILGDALLPASEFDAEVHQSAADIAIIEGRGARPASYANNFCFVRHDLVEGFLRSLPATGFRVLGPS